MTISVIRDRSTPARHVVHVGEHSFTVDLPAGQGGESAGLSPHDLYDAALAACKALTVLFYANNRGIPVEDIHVSVDRDDRDERHGTYRLSTSLEVTGQLDEAQRAALLRVAGKCPIHKLMTEIKTEVTTAWATKTDVNETHE